MSTYPEEFSRLEEENAKLKAELDKQKNISANKEKWYLTEYDKHRWIPVAERLPKEAKEIWTATPDGVIERWYWTDTLYEKDRIRRIFTHWKPIILPEQ